MKKILAIVMALAIVLGMCACGGTGIGGDQNKYDESGKVTISIGIASNAKIISFKENALTRWLEDRTGYNLKFVEYSGGTDVATQITSTIAAGQALPDILWGIGLDSKTISTYGKEGYFVNLKPYYDDKEGASKNFWTRLDEALDESQRDYVLNALPDADTGEIYVVPTVETSLVDTIDYMVWINTQWLDKLGLKMPTNNQELYDTLVAFQKGDPNGNGKQDEIPLFGSQKAGGSAKVINWLINNFMYFNQTYTWQDYNDDGKLEFAQSQDSFREALQYVNKLYKEKLLSPMVYTAAAGEMQKITTPASGEAMCGIFVGHLTTHVTTGSEVLYQYEALPLWGCATERDLAYYSRGFITETAQKRDVVDECFALLMDMWTKETALRMRYGEYGVNWTDPDEGVLSDYGLPATYKLLRDPFTEQNAAIWSNTWCSMNEYCEGETAQTAGVMDEWSAAKSLMHANFRKAFDKAEQEINPKYLKDPFIKGIKLTTKEAEDSEMARTNVASVANSYFKDFVTGSNGRDINDDGDWKEYINELNKQGLEEVGNVYQTVYERQK